MHKNVDDFSADIKDKICSYLYFPYIGFDEIMHVKMNRLLSEINNYKTKKLNILFRMNNFIFPVYRLMYRWICLDKNENILNFIEYTKHTIDFDDEHNIVQFLGIINALTNHQMNLFYDFCIFA